MRRSFKSSEPECTSGCVCGADESNLGLEDLTSVKCKYNNVKNPSKDCRNTLAKMSFEKSLLSCHFVRFLVDFMMLLLSVGGTPHQRSALITLRRHSLAIEEPLFAVEQEKVVEKGGNLSANKRPKYRAPKPILTRTSR